MSDAALIAPIRHRAREPPANTGRALRLSQQQQAAVGGLVAAVKINCEFLTADRWKVEREQRMVVHGGCGGALMHIATCLDNDLLRESRSWRYSRRKILSPGEFSGLAGHTSLDHLGGGGQQFFRDGEAEHLGSTQVDHEVELRRLLHPEVGRFRA